MKIRVLVVTGTLFGLTAVGHSSPTYSASSAALGYGISGGVVGIATTGPFFSAADYAIDNTPMIIAPGATIPIKTFSTLGPPIPRQPATVDFLGNGRFDTAQLSGSLNVSLAAPFTLPPNPNSIYIFPATIQGHFTATPIGPFCGTPGFEACDASANLVVNLPGALTVRLALSPGSPPNCISTSGPLQCGYEITSENFISAPVPEPSSAASLILSSGAMLLGFFVQRKRSSTRLGSVS
jgi:hypothetical protein